MAHIPTLQTLDRETLSGLSYLSGCVIYQMFVKSIGDLIFVVQFREVVYKAFGWSIRTLMVLRDNYFGSFTHFSTLNEFLAKQRHGKSIGDPVELRYRPGSANPLHIELQLDVRNGIVMLPAGLSGYDTSEAQQIRPGDTSIGSCVMATIPQLGLELRTHEDFMGECFLTMCYTY